MNRPRYLLCVSFFYHKLKTIEKHLTTIGNNWQLSKTIENRWNHRRQKVGHVIGWNHGCIFIYIAIGWILLSDLPRPLLTLHAATLRLRYSCFVTLNKVGKTWWRLTFSHEASSGLPHALDPSLSPWKLLTSQPLYEGKRLGIKTAPF